MKNLKRVFVALLGLMLPIVMCAQEEILTNQSILDMLELGFTDDVIVGKIQTTKSIFNTTVEDLKVLKEKGVGNDIIIAMMHSQKSHQEKAEENKVKKTGIFVKVGEEFKKIYPTVFSGSKTNTLGAALSYGLADATIKSTLNGERSQNVIGSDSPEFYFYFDNRQTSELSVKAINWWFSVASSPNEFVLVNLKSKNQQREMGIGKVNLYAGNSMGVDEKSVIKFDIEVLGENEFKVTPSRPLAPGEYCFYYQGIIPVGGYSNQAVFDFSISYIPTGREFGIYDEGDLGTYKKISNGEFVWVLKDGKPKRYIIVEYREGEDGVFYGLSKFADNFKADLYVKASECFKSKKELKNTYDME